MNRSMPPGIFIPVLAYSNVGQVVRWLCDCFGFSERLKIGEHRSQLIFRGASIVVTSRNDDSIQPSFSIMVQVEDVTAHHAHAVARSVKVVSAPTDYPYGERQYSAEDLAGYAWTFSQSIADIDPHDWGGVIVESEYF